MVRLIIVLLLVFQCTSLHAQSETADGKASGSAGSGGSTSTTPDSPATDAITDEDLNDCSVLLGKSKNIEFQHYLSSINKLAEGDLNDGVLYLNNGMHYAYIMHNRFVCNEDEILGEQLWAVTVQNKKGEVIQETPRKTIPFIQKHPVAFEALKDAVAAHIRIADHDVDAHILLAQYFADYNEALGNSQEGYLLLSEAYEVYCGQEIISDVNKDRCVMLGQQKLRYQKWVGPEKRDELDQQARVWATAYLEKNEVQGVNDTEADQNSLKQTALLKGKDFELRAWGSSSDYATDRDQIIDITMASGKSVTDCIDMDGGKSKLDDIRFSPSDSFELKKLITGFPREQLVVRGSAWLTRGEGGVETYFIYRIDEAGITELLHLVTGREFDGDDDRPSLSLTATVQEKIENGELVIVYCYKTDNRKYRTINFRWNGSAFIDATGTYKKLHEKYSP